MPTAYATSGRVCVAQYMSARRTGGTRVELTMRDRKGTAQHGREEQEGDHQATIDAVRKRGATKRGAPLTGPYAARNDTCYRHAKMRMQLGEHHQAGTGSWGTPTRFKCEPAQSKVIGPASHRRGGVSSEMPSERDQGIKRHVALWRMGPWDSTPRQLSSAPPAAREAREAEVRRPKVKAEDAENLRTEVASIE